MIYCPNWQLDENKLLSEIFGKGKALAAIALNSDKLLTPVEAFTKLHDNTEVVDDLRAWDTGSESGKPQKTTEPKIDALILSNPDAKVGGEESFNMMKQRSIRAFTRLLESAPNGSVIVTSSSLMKFIMEFEKQGRPTDWGKITAEKYLAVSTRPGEMMTVQGKNGKIHVIRHGETDENVSAKSLVSLHKTISPEISKRMEETGFKIGPC